VTLFSKVATRVLLAENYFESWRFIPILSFAMVFYALVTFMGSVYTVEKRSVNSLVTSAVGGVVNIVLNLLLIPKWSAMGAAVATLISYFVVMLIRTVDSRRFLRFSLRLPLLVVNGLLLGAQCVITVLEPSWWVAASVGIFVVILAINGRNIVRGILPIVKKLLKKLKKVEKK
jgi:O-antigen/teichoic acid export membrane protein